MKRLLTCILSMLIVVSLLCFSETGIYYAFFELDRFDDPDSYDYENDRIIISVLDNGVNCNDDEAFESNFGVSAFPELELIRTEYNCKSGNYLVITLYLSDAGDDQVNSAIETIKDNSLVKAASLSYSSPYLYEETISGGQTIAASAVKLNVKIKEDAYNAEGYFIEQFPEVELLCIGDVLKDSRWVTFTLSEPGTRALTKAYMSLTSNALIEDVELYAFQNIDPPLVDDSSAVSVVNVDFGDFDLNGRVDSDDALKTLQCAVKKIIPTGLEERRVDVDGKAGVTAADALLVLQRAVGKIPSFPVEN